MQAAYGNLPLSFEANHGQTAPQVKFLARGRGYSLFLTSQEAVLVVGPPTGHPIAPGAGAPYRAVEARSATPPPAVVRMQLVGANADPPVTGHEALPGKSHYLIGHDPQQWRTDIPHYQTVKYEGVYPGVDLLYYGRQGQLEYDFVVRPGADPRAITLAFTGARHVRLGAGGELVLGVGGGEIRQHKPVIYQEVDGVRQVIAGGYRIEDQQHVRFEVGAYDASRPLVIDPVLVYSTYLGGSGLDRGFGIAVDLVGQAYVTGVTPSPDFPTTAGGFQPAHSGSEDAFVTKVHRSGSALVYSTYLGGSGDDSGRGIAVDLLGQAYVTGQTFSADFPVTPGALQTVNAGSDAFVTKVHRSGSALVYSTYLGGSGGDIGSSIAVDLVGQAYVTGQTLSADFPATPGAFQPSLSGFIDAFVAKLNRRGTALVYATYLGGSGLEVGNGVVVDGTGDAYVAGQTGSPDFPVTPGAFQPAFAGGAFDAFVTKVQGSGSALVYSTYLGGSGFDVGSDIAVDLVGQAYVTGVATSLDFPTTAGAFQPAHAGGGSDAFVTKVHRRGTALIYSTYLGGSFGDGGSGSGSEEGLSIAVDLGGQAYVTGQTGSADFPITMGAFQPSLSGFRDAFVTKLQRSGAALAYSTYLGGSGEEIGLGIAVDLVGQAYVTGQTSSADFPITMGAFQPAHAGGTYDAFVAKIGHDDEDEDDN